MHRGLTTLDVLVIGLLAIGFFEIVLGGLRTYLFAHTTSRIDAQLGAKLFQHLLALPIAYFESRQTGQTVARVRELENIRQFLTSSALTLIIDLAFTVVFFVVMYYYSPTLTYIVLASLPVYLLLSLSISPALKRRIEERFERGAQNQSFLVETISGVETLKAMAVEPQMRQRWEESLAGYIRASFRTITLGTFGSQAVSLINKVVTAALLWFGANARRRRQSDGRRTRRVQHAGRAGEWADPATRAALAGLPAVPHFDRAARRHPQHQDGSDPSATHPNLPPIRGDIKFESVTFRYRPGLPEVLRNLSLQIKGRAGDRHRRSLRLRQIDADQTAAAPARAGERPHPHRRHRRRAARSRLAAPPDRRRAAGERAVQSHGPRQHRARQSRHADGASDRAAQLAAAHEFILQLPQGYDTVLEERGSNLSGGQRQRIAIARALATNPRILVFDEATSALDYESEAIIQQNMRDICQGRTVFLVAHRLSTVRRADRIIVMDKGEVVEDGPHDQLVAQGGIYADLVRQSEG